MPELAAAWIADHHPHLAARSASFYTTHLELRVLPYFAATPVAMITPRDVNEWIGWMQAKGRVKTDEKTGKVKRLPSSATVVNGAIRTVKAMMRWSRRSGLTTSRVFDDAVQLPTPNAHAPTAYPPSVVQRIADACIDAQDRALILTAAYTGLRWSELRALCWERVDLQQRTVRVVGAVDADGVTIRQPKTRQGLRLVPILEPGVEALRAWQAECGRRHGLVFTSGAGTPLRENWYRDRMPGIRERAKLPAQGVTDGAVLIGEGLEDGIR
jgi:integrase